MQRIRRAGEPLITVEHSGRDRGRRFRIDHLPTIGRPHPVAADPPLRAAAEQPMSGPAAVAGTCTLASEDAEYGTADETRAVVQTRCRVIALVSHPPSVYSTRRWADSPTGAPALEDHTTRHRTSGTSCQIGLPLNEVSTIFGSTRLHTCICSQVAMYRLPTFVRATLDQYKVKRGLSDDYLRFGALQSVYATIVKYVGTTFALVAADHNPDLKDEVWGAIFDSTSLGGWIQAADAVCRVSSKLPSDVKAYCDIYSDYRKHESRDTLDKITDNLNTIVSKLAELGYRIDSGRSLSLIRALGYIITIRNKCAHGVPDPHFFSLIEEAFFSSLKLMLTIIPFSSFTFWGKYGSNSIEFVEHPPPHNRRSPYAHFWTESDLLSENRSENIPFLVYKADSRTIYCLNDKVDVDKPTSEFIDHSSGLVTYRDVHRDWPQTPSPRRLIRPRYYGRHINALSRDFNWRDIALTKASVEACSDDIGIYVFVARVSLGNLRVDVILYVGKTTNLKERLRSYVRIKRGYDTRPGITHMFRVYGDEVKMLFSQLRREDLAAVENAIYETTMPEYNFTKPPSDG